MKEASITAQTQQQNEGNKTLFLQQRKKQQNLAKYDIAGQLQHKFETEEKLSTVKKRKGNNAIAKKTLKLDSPAEKKASLSSTRQKKLHAKQAQKAESAIGYSKEPATVLPDVGSFQTDTPARVTAAKLCQD